MTDVHIICHRPAPYTHPQQAGYPIICAVVPSIAETEVIINGMRVTCVESIQWTVGGLEPSRAVITFLGATIEASGAALESAPICAACGGACEGEHTVRVNGASPVPLRFHPECLR